MNFKQFYNDGKVVVTSGRPGPSVAFMAGVHGNEPCGLEAFKFIFDQGLRLDKGSVTFLLGSRKAVELNKRAYEYNLNRMFRDDSELSKEELGSYEYGVSRQLMGELKEIDVLLDIHSSSAVDTVPFVICQPSSYRLAACLPVKTVVSGLDDLHPLGTDGYMNKVGKKGLCIECGFHDDPDAKGVAVKAILSMISSLGMFEEIKEVTLKKEKQVNIKVASIFICKNEFRATRSFGDFEFVRKGEMIGYDGPAPVFLQKDAVLLFVSDNQKPGGEAFVMGSYYS